MSDLLLDLARPLGQHLVGQRVLGLDVSRRNDDRLDRVRSRNYSSRIERVEQALDMEAELKRKSLGQP